MMMPNADPRNLDRSIQRHPTPEQLRAFGLGQLGSSEAALVEKHVENCDVCCRVLSEVPDDTVLAKFKNCDTVTHEGPPQETPIESETAHGQIPLALQEHPRYRVLKLLGRGGMGDVYKAEHRLMERPVALKVISRRLIANRSAVERFQREVKLAARLTHPNIVVAHDAEQAGDLHFLVMEFVDGVSLAQFVERKGPLPVPLASLLIRQAALGLQAAAQQGMIHRDIKPQNLMLTRKGRIKILDFGLARFATEGPQESIANESPLNRSDGLTSAGTILGTPDYMAPEQAEDSSQADIRADIYSLGCTFFFLLTGHAPFAGDSVTRTLQSHIDRKPPSLLALRPDLPPEIVRIIERMMAKDPAARFQKPSELAAALVSFATDGLASLQQWEAITINRPANRAGLGETEAEEPPTTIELVRRRRWRTLWNRTRYETRKFFRLPHRRVVAMFAVVLGTILLTAFLAEWFATPPTNPTPSTVVAQTSPSSPVSSASSPRPTQNATRTPFRENVVANPATQVRVALLVTLREVNPRDYQAMRRELESHGAAISVVSSQRGWAVLKGSTIGREDNFRVDLGIEDIRPGQFDAIVIIPASASEIMSDQQLRKVSRQKLQEQYDQGVCLASVGNAVILLAEYGFLEGQPAIAPDWVRRLPQIKNLNINWSTAERVVSAGKEGRLITAHDASNAPILTERILQTIKNRKNP